MLEVRGLISNLLLLGALLVPVSGHAGADPKPIPECATALASDSYDIEATTVPGQSRKFTVRLGAKSVQFKIFSQPERERRLNLPEELGSPAGLAANLLQYFYREGNDRLKIKTYGRVDLGETWAGEVYLAPLSSVYEEFHESSMSMNMRSLPRRIAQWLFGKKQAGRLVREIFGAPYEVRMPQDPEERMHSRRDYIESTHLVGFHNEVGMYFDSDESLLEKSGIAARAKFWFEKEQPPESLGRWPVTAELKNAVQRSLTIKLTRADEGLFTRRDEHFIPLTSDITPEDISIIARQALITLLGRDPLAGAPLTATKRVDTERIGLKLMATTVLTGASEPVKFGFMTVDRFKVHDLRTPKAEGPDSRTQVEIELLPGQTAMMLENTQRNGQLESFLRELETRFKAVKNHRPKYLQ